jgi:hypothetical protein
MPRTGEVGRDCGKRRGVLTAGTFRRADKRAENLREVRVASGGGRQRRTDDECLRLVKRYGELKIAAAGGSVRQRLARSWASQITPARNMLSEAKRRGSWTAGKGGTVANNKRKD